MPTALSDPSPTLYLILIIVALVLAGVWLRRQSRGDLIRFLIAIGALLAVYLIDRFCESPREEASRKIEEMAQASRDKKWDDLFKHVADSFKYNGPSGIEIDKKGLREKLKLVEGIPEFKGAVILDMHRADYRVIDEKTATVGFLACAKDYPVKRWFVIATFAKEPDGQWRMTDFKGYDELKQDHHGPQIAINGLDGPQ
jgi:hypothetical protein